MLRMARTVAADYELTDEETAEMLRDMRRALARWRAGLPIGLDWVLDDAARQDGLSDEERAALEADVRSLLTEPEGAR